MPTKYVSGSLCSGASIASFGRRRLRQYAEYWAGRRRAHLYCPSQRDFHCWARPDPRTDATYQPAVAGCPPDVPLPKTASAGPPSLGSHGRRGYAWWIDRVRRLMAIADVFRIDHSWFRWLIRHPASEPTARVGTWLPGRCELFDAIAAALGEHPSSPGPGTHYARRCDANRQMWLPGMKVVVQFGFGGDATTNICRTTSTPTAPPTAALTTATRCVAGGNAGPVPAEKRYAGGAYLVAGDHDIHWGAIRACANSVATSRRLSVAGCTKASAAPHEHSGTHGRRQLALAVRTVNADARSDACAQTHHRCQRARAPTMMMGMRCK